MEQRTTAFGSSVYRMGFVAFILGFIIIIVSTYFHVSTHDLNDHALTFPVYAASDTWIAAHIGQLAGVLLVFAGGFVALSRFLTQSPSSASVALAWLGLATTIIAATTFTILQGVDGVALKRAVDSWNTAPADEKVAAFRVAEGIRWLEQGINSMFRILQGAISIIFGVSILLSRLLSRWIGAFGLVAGVTTIIAGIGTAYLGFVDLPIVGLVATVTSFIWLIILAVFMWRKSNAMMISK